MAWIPLPQAVTESGGMAIIRFAIFEKICCNGDSYYDSLLLIDNVRFD